MDNMCSSIRNSTIAGIVFFSSAVNPSITSAQIVPDTTLPTHSTVTSNGNRFTIEGGSTAGGNLFHSFGEFSLPTGTEAFFNNAIAIENIITRVTGGNVSNIDGLIQANGTANLFLINPNGVVFGPNARLAIGGSAIVSSADRLEFGDGSFYSATEPNAALLTVSVPVGLQYGANPGAIVNRSQVTDDSGNRVGLSVQPGRTLALIGGDVKLESGSAIAPTGRVELAGVGENGRVSLTPTPRGFEFGYQDAALFRDVQLSGGALVDVSGDNSGEVQVQARRFQVRDRSNVVSINSGSEPGGAIAVNAIESVQFVGNGTYVPDLVAMFEGGIANNADLPNGLFTANVGTGAGGNIEINTRQFSATDGAFIYAITEGAGGGGDFTLNAADTVQLSGASLRANVFFETTGAGGDLTVNTTRLRMQEGAEIGAIVEGVGQGGNLTVNASEAIELIGTELIVAERSDGEPLISNTGLFAAADTGSSGDAGELRVSTKRLSVRNGGALVVNSTGTGRPGNLFLTATESAEFIGTSPGEFSSPSSILAGAFDPSATGTGGGNVTVVVGNLRVREGATISVSNLAPGSGGSIEIVADSIRLEDEASIVSETAFGGGGNIRLQTRDLQLRDRSTISVTAGSAENPVGLPPEVAAVFAPLATGAGDGGNITIETDNLIAFDNSDIIANAREGRGGRVTLSARGIFGIEFREAETPESDITATSELGAEFSGTVEIINPDLDPGSGLVDLPVNVTDPSTQIVAGCAADSGNSFIVTGRGGLPQDPVSGLIGRAIWWDDRDLLATGNTASVPPENPTPTTPLQEATGLAIDPDGRVQLVANHGAGISGAKSAECLKQQMSDRR